MNTSLKLQEVFSSNFVVYYKAHAAHVNVTGRNFVSDHKLLGDIYEDLQDQIDIIAEILRTLKQKMPMSLYNVMSNNRITEDFEDNLLEQVYDDVEELIDLYKELNDVATDDRLDHIANYAQERVLALEKFCWMLRSTIGDDDDQSDAY